MMLGAATIVLEIIQYLDIELFQRSVNVVITYIDNAIRNECPL